MREGAPPFCPRRQDEIRVAAKLWTWRRVDRRDRRVPLRTRIVYFCGMVIEAHYRITSALCGSPSRAHNGADWVLRTVRLCHPSTATTRS